MATPLRHVAIEGAIGVGKTTLTHRLAAALGGAVMLENLRKTRSSLASLTIGLGFTDTVVVPASARSAGTRHDAARPLRSAVSCRLYGGEGPTVR